MGREGEDGGGGEVGGGEVGGGDGNLRHGARHPCVEEDGQKRKSRHRPPQLIR